ncbi:hypothetical protein F4775DRAFT_573699 [Biscogniauxia sp. FL1348]|nr:hypothetical protein F4775DRAFT_573699 [Biscogniauxia sp. FL1348]
MTQDFILPLSFFPAVALIRSIRADYTHQGTRCSPPSTVLSDRNDYAPTSPSLPSHTTRIRDIADVGTELWKEKEARTSKTKTKRQRERERERWSV